MFVGHSFSRPFCGILPKINISFGDFLKLFSEQEIIRNKDFKKQFLSGFSKIFVLSHPKFLQTKIPYSR